MPSVTGNEQADRENQEKASQRLAATTSSVKNLKQLQTEDWAIKRISKTSAEVNFNILAKEGETDRATSPVVRPIINLGNEALTSLEMGRITLRHELDHAKLQEDGKTLRLGGFVASYKTRANGERAHKGGFEYELEELIVRLRDWQRLKRGRTKATSEYTLERAEDRIKQQFTTMCKAPDRSDYDESDVADIMKKLFLIANDLEITLE